MDMMRKKNDLTKAGILYIMIVTIIVLMPMVTAAHDREKRVSPAYDPGSGLKYIYPAVDANDDIAVVAYCEENTNTGESKLYILASYDEGETFGTRLRVSPGVSGRPQYHPDVAVVKMEVEDGVIDVIY
ncbi:MAG: hypothetical protein QCI82_09490, partial [Candidatus Thermoplasmatota archaeon]|nr:hypothetical protein [Candidatus Thermoplasmatota archaeon]